MQGVNYRVVPKALYTVPGSAATGWWIARGVDVTPYTTGALVVRLHTGSNLTAGTLTVQVWQDAPTPEDHTDFLPNGWTASGAGSSGYLAQFQITTSTVINTAY